MNNFKTVSRTRDLPGKTEQSKNLVAGEVRRPGMSYRISSSWENGRLSGRLGGAVFGENVLLELLGNQILGTAASTGRVLALCGRQEGGRLEYRLLGNGSHSAFFELRDRALSGRVYGEDRSQPLSAESGPVFTLAKVGLGAEAQEIALEHPDLPPLVQGGVLLLADITSREAWRVLLSSYQGIAGG